MIWYHFKIESEEIGRVSGLVCANSIDSAIRAIYEDYGDDCDIFTIRFVCLATDNLIFEVADSELAKEFDQIIDDMIEDWYE